MPECIPRPKKALSVREVGVCQRLREIRQRLNLSQGEVASQLGISRERLASYEEGRAPVRYEFALRFCWQLVVSEEWLALGESAILDRLKAMGGKDEKFIWHPSQARWCMSLLCDPIYHKIRPQSMFTEAFDSYLAEAYRKRRSNNFGPVILYSDAINDSLIRNYAHALLESWMESQNSPAEKIRFLRSAVHAGFKIKLAIQSGELTDFERLDLLQAAFESGALSDSRALTESEELDFVDKEKPKYLARFLASGRASQKNNLTDDSLKGNSKDVKTELEKLIARVKRLASRPGAKTELARVLDVAPARVTEWLTDDKEKRKEPGGHYTLQLLKWVEQQERQK